ncbi:MAG: HNH endonuclease [Bacteroidales bacterium]|nr:HNH endonuclease [Bacteroidales bacterium]MBO7183857.1 HNH endonuclease [Bacteroidales bacterium]
MLKSNKLSVDDVLALLPTDYKPLEIINTRQKLYQSPKGVVIFRESKVYQDKNVLWTAVNKDVLDDVSYLCLTAGYLGVLMIPASVLVQYFDNNSISTLKNGRKNIRIRIEGERFILYDADSPEIDLSSYFISSENDDSICDLIQSASIEEIWKKAEQFVDYEEQYREGFGIKLRRESKMQKERISRIEEYTCQICGFHQAYVNKNGKQRFIIQVDHIVEKSQGGGECLNNLLVLCPNCHAKKTYGIIKINPDYTIEENGERKHLKYDRHLTKRHE